MSSLRQRLVSDSSAQAALPFTMKDTTGAYATGKVVTVTLNKPGTTTAVAVNGTVTEVSSGSYVFQPASTDFNVVGDTQFIANATGCAATIETIKVCSELEAETNFATIRPDLINTTFGPQSASSANGTGRAYSIGQ